MSYSWLWSISSLTEAFFCYRNGSHICCSKEESPKFNGVHDGYSCNGSTVNFLEGSKDHLQKNGYAHPLNGALKQQENVFCTKSIHQGVEFRCPQPNPRGMETCPSIGSTSPSRVTYHEGISDSSMLSEPPSATIVAIQEKQVESESSFGQVQTSRFRLNGSHHVASDVTLTGKQSAQGPETGIISEFFSHSRLHHISTWRNEFSEYVNTLQGRRRAAGGAMFPGKDKLKKLIADHCAGNVIKLSLLCILVVNEFCCELVDGCNVCVLSVICFRFNNVCSDSCFPQV